MLAIASVGGHLEQLMQLAPAWSRPGSLLVIAAAPGQQTDRDPALPTVRDCHSGQWLAALICFVQILWIAGRTRPRCIVTTGALPGFLAVIAGRLTGATTIWIDSLANAERLSTSGRCAARVANRVYTQWPSVVGHERATYIGSLF